MLGFLEVLHQVQATLNTTSSSLAFRTRLALSGIAESAVQVTLASGLLRQSHGCAILPTPAGLTEFSAAATGTAQREVAAEEGAQQTAETGGANKPVTDEPPSACIEPPASAADGPGAPRSESAGAGASSSDATNNDDADFINLLTAPHARHEVSTAILHHTISQG